MRKTFEQILSHIEIVAYLLAFWSFFVLFLEPLIGYYTDYARVENYTAVANLVLLLLTILNRVLFGEAIGKQKIILLDMIMLVMGTLLLLYSAKFVIFFLLVRQTYFILQFLLFRFSQGKLYHWLSGNPPVTLLLSFALVIFLGMVLLMLPVSSAQNRVTPMVDALFTSTSATCVTGLIVVDTGGHWSFFGQLVILVLIQIGGLGIMTVSTVFALLLGQNINLKLKNVMSQVVGGSRIVNVFTLLKNIALVTVIIETVGAVLLFFKFSQDFSTQRAIYQAVFHSVSAFCNAGFSLFSDNMMGYGGSPIVSFTIPLLILLGGIGFTVIIDINRFVFYRDRVKKLSLHTKIVLSATALLIIAGFLVFFVFEYNGTMQGFSLFRRFISSLFQSITTRTAGFNTVDIGALGKSTLMVVMALMFIGASPGSTGGGIKTTTFAVLAFTIVSLLKGKKDITIFKRRLPIGNFREATGVAILSAAIVFTVLVLLMLVESQPFEKVLFEALSAFGTVGLSTGITSELSMIGKLLITLLMYIGRIGPLTLIYAFSLKKKHTNINYAEETIAIG
ncbi:MAG: TrkH family potassium uptake protein [Candidatus Syntrophosphaera sp.]|nr:TrkH family potassium uptake protein [Candidatus Syntrophosphaera sp.]